MLETKPQRGMNQSVEVAFTIVPDTVAQDEIVHSTADVDRIDLNVPLVLQDRGDRRAGHVEKLRPAHELAGF